MGSRVAGRGQLGAAPTGHTVSPINGALKDRRRTPIIQPVRSIYWQELSRVSVFQPVLRAAPRSPCVNVCTLDGHDTCMGCFRTRAEITGWVRASAEQQWAIVTASEVRRRGVAVGSVLP